MYFSKNEFETSFGRLKAQVDVCWIACFALASAHFPFLNFPLGMTTEDMIDISNNFDLPCSRSGRMELLENFFHSQTGAGHSQLIYAFYIFRPCFYFFCP